MARETLSWVSQGRTVHSAMQPGCYAGILQEQALCEDHETMQRLERAFQHEAANLLRQCRHSRWRRLAVTSLLALLCISLPATVVWSYEGCGGDFAVQLWLQCLRHYA